MLAYHNNPELKKCVVAQMKAHREADELVKGQYWENGKGCAVGCLLKSGNHIEYEKKFGIPVALARLEDCIFEGLDNGDSQKWPERFLSAIKPGADLSLVQWKFLHWLQKENLKTAKKNKMPVDVISAIKQCVDVLAPLTKGEPVNRSAARSAWAAAWAAAESAARSAARSAGAAAESAGAAWAAGAAAAESAARAHYKKMADKLIELIKDAPMHNAVRG